MPRRTAEPAPARLTITVDGSRALTIDLAAAEHGLSHDAMRKTLDRYGIEPIPDARIGRMPLYDAERVQTAVGGRVGRGAPGIPRPHRAGSGPS